MAQWSGAPVSLPAICKLWVRFPSPPGHATLPNTMACDLYAFVVDLYDIYAVAIVHTYRVTE